MKIRNLFRISSICLILSSVNAINSMEYRDPFNASVQTGRPICDIIVHNYSVKALRIVLQIPIAYNMFVTEWNSFCDRCKRSKSAGRSDFTIVFGNEPKKIQGVLKKTDDIFQTFSKKMQVLLYKFNSLISQIKLDIASTTDSDIKQKLQNFIYLPEDVVPQLINKLVTEVRDNIAKGHLLPPTSDMDYTNILLPILNIDLSTVNINYNHSL